MAKTEITVYGAYWCPDCRQSKQFLGEHQIPYNWIDIEEDKEGEKFSLLSKQTRANESFPPSFSLTAPS